jgi:molybdopterin synthase sulfur carrier subunit
MDCVLKYYGLIKDITKLDEEKFLLADSKPTLNNLKAVIENQYPDLKHTVYSFAVNQRLIADDVELNTNDEIALLPPFAGG